MRLCYWISLPLLLLVLSFQAHSGGEAGEEVVNHVVVAWMKKEFRTEEAIAELIAAHERLREIPGLVSLSVGRSLPSEREVVDSSFDVASVFQFESEQAMKKYLKHPIHVEFLDRHTKGKVERVVIYDFQS